MVHTVMTHPIEDAGSFVNWIRQKHSNMIALGQSPANGNPGRFVQQNTDTGTYTVHAWRIFVDQAACDEWETFVRSELEIFGGTLDSIDVLDYVPGGTWTPPVYNTPV
jgi:hypothetical protein